MGKRYDERNQEVRNLILENLEEIYCMKSNVFKCICLFSLVDMFAQNEEYGDKNCVRFSVFLRKYADCEMLDTIDPITLYYDNIDVFEKRDMNILGLGNACEYDWESIRENECVNALLEYANDSIKSEMLNKHKYVSLLYKYRSKLVHEHREPSVMFDFMQSYTTPMYYQCREIDGVDRYRLCFPFEFIKNISVISINRYLDDCLDRKVDPFYFENKRYYSWYEK